MKYHLLYVLVRGVNSQEFVVVWVVCSPTLSGFIRSFNVILSSSKLLRGNCLRGNHGGHTTNAGF